VSRFLPGRAVLIRDLRFAWWHIDCCLLGCDTVQSGLGYRGDTCSPQYKHLCTIITHRKQKKRNCDWNITWLPFCSLLFIFRSVHMIAKIAYWLRQVRPSFHMYQHGSHWMGFCEI
jgi:hypothetical protein